MCRTFKNINRGLFFLLMIVISVTPACRTSSSSSPADALQILIDSKNVELVHQIPLQFDTYHVQGLELTEQFFFVTSVDTKQKRAWLFQIDRQDGRLISQKDLTEGSFIHPGGIQVDNRYLWVPNAEYRKQSRTIVYGIDPDNLKICASFEVDDHIGAIASDGKNHLYGVNWDAVHFYVWDFDGRQLKKVNSPTSAAYQDIKFYVGKLLCSGHQDGRSVIDVIDPKTWSLVKRIDLPRDRWKTNLSREGMTFDGNLYCLPDDGPDSTILIFALR